MGMSRILDNPENYFSSLTNQEFVDLLNKYGIKHTKINKYKREVKIYQKYKHFKGNEIITVGISKPISRFEDVTIKESYKILFDDTNNWCVVTIYEFVEREGYYHVKKTSSKDIVMYKTLNMNTQIFARTEEDFLSKVDKAKDPEFKQEYILEEISRLEE